ncbi:MAG: hypothetical protein WCH37_08980, partial [Synechococcaceae cyanobacterium ELA182]
AAPAPRRDIHAAGKLIDFSEIHDSAAAQRLRALCMQALTPSQQNKPAISKVKSVTASREAKPRNTRQKSPSITLTYGGDNRMNQPRIPQRANKAR